MSELHETFFTDKEIQIIRALCRDYIDEEDYPLPEDADTMEAVLTKTVGLVEDRDLYPIVPSEDLTDGGQIIPQAFREQVLKGLSIGKMPTPTQLVGKRGAIYFGPPPATKIGTVKDWKLTPKGLDVEVKLEDEGG